MTKKQTNNQPLVSQTTSGCGCGQKQNKSETNNQWTSVPQAMEGCNCEQKKDKTATDNQWTSTHK